MDFLEILPLVSSEIASVIHINIILGIPSEQIYSEIPSKIYICLFTQKIFQQIFQKTLQVSIEYSIENSSRSLFTNSFEDPSDNSLESSRNLSKIFFFNLVWTVIEWKYTNYY